jgi:hypothetical protein
VTAARGPWKQRHAERLLQDRDALADVRGELPSSVAVAAKLRLRAARQNTRRSSSSKSRFTIRES